MNAPLHPAGQGALQDTLAQALAAVRLDDKYTMPRGRVFMSGVQALVRLPMLQRQRDAATGLNTAGFVSGYRGSPLGGYDLALWGAREHLRAHDIVFQPGVNEELAATAVWGTQQLDLYPEQQRFDGVFGLWYGKGPGVDRSADVFKHANMAGTARLGGVIAVAGDDHVAKSSTAAHQSDHLFKACGLPVFFPASVQEILDLGLHAWAMSRFAGVWAGLKTIQEIVESSTTVEVDPQRVKIVLPEDFVTPPGGLHIRWPDPPLEQEARLMDHKWYAALAYVRANRLNYTVFDSPRARLGLIASGKAYNDTRQALHDLGLTEGLCAQLGIRLHKVGVVWPLEASITREFATGLQEILVIEEKRQVIEYQLKEELYNWRADVRPDVLGKFNEPDGDHTGGEWSMANPSAHWLLRAKADLNPALIAKAIAQRMMRLGLLAQAPSDLRSQIAMRLALIEAKDSALDTIDLQATGDRAPWFCSGCPHNTSTRVPEGSRAVAGIGCHYMVTWMDRATSTFTPMGGEGVPWVGQAPFSKDKHLFANLGDGTYYHSGLLAIRQAIAAKVNITYKILINGAVAMTGGQPIEGELSVAQMARELQAEGVRRVAVVSDEPEKHRRDADLSTLISSSGGSLTVHHRRDLDTVQRECRELPGVTVILYEQACATEKRRQRKRGQRADAGRRVLINEAVCEGCGDCSVQSNCLSVEPVETPLGRKRRINQSNCNQDFSCVEGFCPSFVSVVGAQPRRAATAKLPALERMPALPMPERPSATERAWGIVVAGVGGTGVITIGQVLGMAAHLDGQIAVTQDAAGLAQKGGATWSHIQIARTPQVLHTTKVGAGEADLVLACDAIVAARKETLAVLRAGRSRVVLNTHGMPTAAVVKHRDWTYPASQCEQALADAGGAALTRLDADQLAAQLLGDAIYANPLMLGVAWQVGAIPLSREAVMQAIRLNGVQVDSNLAAFEWGRHAAHDLAAVQRVAAPAHTIAFLHKLPLQTMRMQYEARLRAYQDDAYATRYREVLDRVVAAETRTDARSTRLSEAVAHGLFKLMAYKDEYEVARLHSDPDFLAQLQAQFEPKVPGATLRLRFHLAPPLWARRDAQGQPMKASYGAWMLPVFRGLTHLKGLRGTWADPFGWTAERRAERALREDYIRRIETLLPQLNTARLDLAVQMASVPQDIRGYGHVKAQAMAVAAQRWHALSARWTTEAPAPGAVP